MIKKDLNITFIDDANVCDKNCEHFNDEDACFSEKCFEKCGKVGEKHEQ